MFFSQLAAQIFGGHLKQVFGPSYFVKALGGPESASTEISSVRPHFPQKRLLQNVHIDSTNKIRF